MGIEHMEDIIYIIRKDKTKYSQAIFLLKKKKKKYFVQKLSPVGMKTGRQTVSLNNIQ